MLKGRAPHSRLLQRMARDKVNQRRYRDRANSWFLRDPASWGVRDLEQAIKDMNLTDLLPCGTTPGDTHRSRKEEDLRKVVDEYEFLEEAIDEMRRIGECWEFRHADAKLKRKWATFEQRYDAVMEWEGGGGLRRWEEAERAGWRFD